MFAAPAYDAAAPDAIDRDDPDFALWVDQNVKPHKQPGYAIATISLEAVGGIPGDATAEQIDLMAGLPSATASTNCASPTRRTSCCPMCARPISMRSGRRSTAPGSPPPIST